MNLFAYGTLMAATAARGPRRARRRARLRPPGCPAGGASGTCSGGVDGGVLNLEPTPSRAVGMLVEGLEADLAARRAEATHLPRETVYVEPSRRGAPRRSTAGKGNHAGKPSGRYKPSSRPGVPRRLGGLRELCRGTVDAAASRSRSADARPPAGYPPMSPERVPAIKVLLLPKDTNALGTIFGGVILSHIDLASAVEARKTAPAPLGDEGHARGRVPRAGLPRRHRELLHRDGAGRAHVDHGAACRWRPSAGAAATAST